VSEEARQSSSLVPDATESDVHLLYGLVDGVGAAVGELSTLEVPPYLLETVEVLGIAGQPFDHEPVALGGEVVAHGPAAM